MQIATASRELGSSVRSVDDHSWYLKVLVEMRDVLKKDDLMVQRNVVEKHKVLMNLSHISDVWNDRNPKFAGE